jgi:hypothetical protein
VTVSAPNQAGRLRLSLAEPPASGAHRAAKDDAALVEQDHSPPRACAPGLDLELCPDLSVVGAEPQLGGNP